MIYLTILFPQPVKYIIYIYIIKIRVRATQEECLVKYSVKKKYQEQYQFCKIRGVHGSDYEECFLLGYENPVHTPQETHYVSATEPSWLMLCKIWGFHGGDYDERSFLGYEIPVPTSQETHHVSTIEPSRLILCKIWSFHGCHYEKCCLPGRDTVWLL
jgi:hypothetical protein